MPNVEKDAPRMWRVGDPINYADPNCECATSGMGRRTDCPVHGQYRVFPPGEGQP